MTCERIGVDDHCPKLEDVENYLLALLPSGRAWRTNIDGPEEGSILRSFWKAVAKEFHRTEERICAFLNEVNCAGADKLYLDWLEMYGLPDPCDPFPDLCSKVAAIGGSRCEYFQDIAARAGWKIECVEAGQANTIGCLQMGDYAFFESPPSSTLKLKIFLSESPAYGGGTQSPVILGCYSLGSPNGCGPDLAPLKCLLARILPAHLDVTYEVIE